MNTTKRIPNISARDFATILCVNPYQTPFQLLEQKIEGKYPFFGNKFTDHGNKYEQVAIDMYAKTTGNAVQSKQVNTKHREYPWITGRIDGLVTMDDRKRSREEDEEPPQGKSRKRQKISNDKVASINVNQIQICTENIRIDTQKNIIVEVKCPLSKKKRDEPLNLQNIPIYYWTQIQVYLNMFNCEKAHYVEFYIEPDAPHESGLLEYISVYKDTTWWDESLPRIKSYYEEIKKYHELGDLETHPVRILEKEWEKIFS